jgi:hypothetical protein
MTSAGQDDVFVGLLDTSLGYLWGAHYGDKVEQAAFGGAADPTGGVGIVGGYLGTLDFGLGALPSSTSSQSGMFIAQLAADGGAFRNFGSGSSTYAAVAQGVAFMTWPDFVISGQCSGTVPFPFGSLACGGGDLFVARLKP